MSRPSLWPLRHEVLKHVCEICGLPAAASSCQARRCISCAAGHSPPQTANLQCAVVSLLFGDAYAAPALALGHCLRKCGTSKTCILMHTADVPTQQLTLLREVWHHLVIVSYIKTQDLDSTGQFRTIFTKLHCLSPDVLGFSVGGPFDKVLFLDLDILVRGHLDELFDLRPPAAMHNDKEQPPHVEDVHGSRLPIDNTYINAGVMILAPNSCVFSALRADVEAKDPDWHWPARCPEQCYLSDLFAGEFTHISQVCNFEVMPHGGTPLTGIWQRLQVADICVVHFSGGPKVWSTEVGEEIENQYWTNHGFNSLPASVAQLARERQRVLFGAWHVAFQEALDMCQKRLLPWQVPAEIAAALPKDYINWLTTSPPLARLPNERVDAVLCRLPRTSLKRCARPTCPMLCTWHVSHCCRRCRWDDVPTNDLDDATHCDIRHGPQCDLLLANSPESSWDGPASERRGDISKNGS